MKLCSSFDCAIMHENARATKGSPGADTGGHPMPILTIHPNHE